MPNFSYQGRNAGGDMVRGVQEGVSASAVAEQLSGQGITPLDITQAQGAPSRETGTGSSAISLFRANALSLNSHFDEIPSLLIG